MAKITDEDFIIFEKVEEVVLEHFGIPWERIIKKDTSNEASLARNMLHYILHCDFKLSIGKIATRYHRTERNIKYQVAIMRVCIGNGAVYQALHDDLLSRIERA